MRAAFAETNQSFLSLAGNSRFAFYELHSGHPDESPEDHWLDDRRPHSVRETGLTSLRMAIPSLAAGEGVANLTVGRTLTSMGVNGIVNGVLVGGAFEVGVSVNAGPKSDTSAG
jgi:hypothetical protein